MQHAAGSKVGATRRCHRPLPRNAIHTATGASAQREKPPAGGFSEAQRLARYSLTTP
jgi:hypothetical protein